MFLKKLLNGVKQKWKPENGTVSMWDLIMAKLLVKLCNGLTYISSPVEKAMSKIQSEAFVIRSRAKATIVRRNIEIEPVEFTLIGSNGTLPQWTIPTGSGLTVANTVPNSTITFNQNNKPVLVITNDGDVEWHGKPSEAADALQTVFQFKVEDMKGVTKAARRRYYLRACQNILNKAEKMEHNQFVAFLQKQVYNKERRVIMDSLKGNENAD